MKKRKLEPTSKCKKSLTEKFENQPGSQEKGFGLQVNSYATILFRQKLAQVQNEMRELGIIQAC